MIKNNAKILVFGLLVLLGAALLAYGAFFHSTTVSAQQGGESVMLAKSETALIKDASVSGVKRDETGKIKQTYEIGEKAPETCST
jgi:F0F1-type ATP synthase assembly protein I